MIWCKFTKLIQDVDDFSCLLPFSKLLTLRLVRVMRILWIWASSSGTEPFSLRCALKICITLNFRYSDSVVWCKVREQEKNKKGEREREIAGNSVPSLSHPLLCLGLQRYTGAPANCNISCHDTNIDIWTTYCDIMILPYDSWSTFKNNCINDSFCKSKPFYSYLLDKETRKFHLCFVKLCTLPIRHVFFNMAAHCVLPI